LLIESVIFGDRCTPNQFTTTGNQCKSNISTRENHFVLFLNLKLQYMILTPMGGSVDTLTTGSRPRSKCQIGGNCPPSKVSVIREDMNGTVCRTIVNCSEIIVKITIPSCLPIYNNIGRNFTMDFCSELLCKICS